MQGFGERRRSTARPIRPPSRNVGPPVDGDRQHLAAVIVRVLAYEVDAPGGGGDYIRLASEFPGEQFRESLGRHDTVVLRYAGTHSIAHSVYEGRDSWRAIAGPHPGSSRFCVRLRTLCAVSGAPGS